MLSKSDKKGLLAWVLCLGVGCMPIAYAESDAHDTGADVDDINSSEDIDDEHDDSEGIRFGLELAGVGFTIANAGYKSQAAVSILAQDAHQLDSGYTLCGALGLSSSYPVYEKILGKVLVQGMLGYNLSDRTPRSTGYKFVPFGGGARFKLSAETYLSGDEESGVAGSLGIVGALYRTAIAPGGRAEGVRYTGNLYSLGAEAGVAMQFQSVRVAVAVSASPVYGVFYPSSDSSAALDGVPREVSEEVLAGVRARLTKELGSIILKNGETPNAVQGAKDLISKSVAQAAKNQTTMTFSMGAIRKALASRGRHSRPTNEIVNQKLLPGYEAAVNAMVDDCVASFYATYQASIIDALDTAINNVDGRGIALAQAFKGLREIADNYYPQPLQQINTGGQSGYQIEGIAVAGELSLSFGLNALVSQL